MNVQAQKRELKGLYMQAKRFGNMASPKEGIERLNNGSGGV